MSVREYIELYTDGSCLKSGVGGWGAILKQPALGHTKELSGSTFPTTNNRMELTAVIEGLKALFEPCAVAVTTDSMYVCNGVMQGWAERWKRNGWVHRAGKMGFSEVPVKNADLWAELLELCLVHMVKVQWVRGHDGHIENERCDTLATEAARLLRLERERTELLVPAEGADDVGLQVPRSSTRRRSRERDAQIS